MALNGLKLANTTATGATNIALSLTPASGTSGPGPSRMVLYKLRFTAAASPADAIGIKVTIADAADQASLTYRIPVASGVMVDMQDEFDVTGWTGLELANKAVCTITYQFIKDTADTATAGTGTLMTLYAIYAEV